MGGRETLLPGGLCSTFATVKASLLHSATICLQTLVEWLNLPVVPSHEMIPR